jgi:putative PIN family toxin of toxin-antitoxin system
MMSSVKILIDTNVILSGLLSQKGTSYKLLQLVPKKKFTIVMSVPLILEYETILHKNIRKLNLSRTDIDDFLDYICAISEHTKIYYLWRPILKDPYDDHILELAVSSNAKYIVTFNISDFNEAKKFGISPIEPDEFLKTLRG